jgi:hypothetical protein
MKNLFARLRQRPVASLIAAVSLVLAVGFGVTAWALAGYQSNSEPPRLSNAAGGYSVVVPAGWTSTEQGRTTTLSSPDKGTLVTFGLGRTGPLSVAGTLFFQQVGGQYHNVQVIPPSYRQVSSRASLVYGGIGTNDKNTRIRFLTITVENQPTNYGIVVFTQANSDPNTVLPAVNQVVDSFRTEPTPAR